MIRKYCPVCDGERFVENVGGELFCMGCGTRIGKDKDNKEVHPDDK